MSVGLPVLDQQKKVRPPQMPKHLKRKEQKTNTHLINVSGNVGGSELPRISRVSIVRDFASQASI
jgi:hypothetical protein